MKRILTLILSVVTLAVGLVAVTACQSTSKVKVFSDYELTAESYAFAIQKGNTALKEQADELIAEITEDGTLDEIINSFFDGEATFTYQNPVSTVPTGDNKSNYLIVATNAAFPPFEYYQGNVFTGIDMQIAKLLADKMGKTLYISDMRFEAVTTTVKDGGCDIGMAGITVNEERLKTLDFSAEYYESAQVLIVREDDERFAECKSVDDIDALLKAQSKSFKIGTQTGTTGYMFSAGDEGFGYDGFTNLTTNAYTTGALAVQDLINKRIDAVIIDKQPAIMIAANYNK